MNEYTIDFHRYHNDSKLKDILSKAMEIVSISATGQCVILKVYWIDTPLGWMCAVSSDMALYLLVFIEQCNLEKQLIKLMLQQKATMMLGVTTVIETVQKELDLYFIGGLQSFKIPIHMLGSYFQKQAWNALVHIPYGKTSSYLEQAQAIDNHQAFRAVANTNAANKLSIIIPCHRIINNNGNLGGYAGGAIRKQLLIDHESQYV